MSETKVKIESSIWSDNSKTMKMAGSLLFILGIIAAMIGLLNKDESIDRTTMALSAAVLLSMGYPLLLYVRTTNRIEMLEKRVSELEQGGPDKAVS